MCLRKRICLFVYGYVCIVFAVQASLKEELSKARTAAEKLYSSVDFAANVVDVFGAKFIKVVLRCVSL